MKKNFWRIVIIGGLLLIALFGFSGMRYANYSAYCAEAGRPLTDEEVLTKVAGEVYAKNPYCCEVREKPWRHDDFSTYVGRFFGFYRKEVVVLEMNNGRDDDASYYKAYITINECGERLGEIGIDVPQGEAKAMMKRFKVNREAQNR